MSSYRVKDKVVVLYGGQCYNALIVDQKKKSDNEHDLKYCWLVDMEKLGLMWACEEEMRKSMTESTIQVTLSPAEYNQFQEWKKKQNKQNK